MSRAASRRWGECSSMDSMQVRQILRRGMLSSTRCLKGPRSTVLSSFMVSVCSRAATTTPRWASTVAGLWCTAVLTMSRAAFLTSRSSSCSRGKNWSITPVMASRATGEDMRDRLNRKACAIMHLPSLSSSAASCCSRGMICADSIEVSTPRHSATMPLTDSSGLLHCCSSRGSASSRWGAKSLSSEANAVTISFKAASSRYWCLGVGAGDRMQGRKVPMFPTAMWPRAYAAQSLVFSAGASKHASSRSVICGTWDRSLLCPTSPTHSRASCLCVGGESVRSVVNRCSHSELSSAPANANVTPAMHLDRLNSDCLESRTSPLPPSVLYSCLNTSCCVSDGRPALTSSCKRVIKDACACACTSADRASSSTFGYTYSSTGAEHTVGAFCIMAQVRRRLRCDRCRSVSAIRAAASLNKASAAGAPSVVAGHETTASTVESVSCLRARLFWRRNRDTSGAVCARKVDRSICMGEDAMAAMAFSVGERVVSFSSLRLNRPSTSGSSAERQSPA
mmetsp:Transcript_4894/g.10667  ORF Transcript_4894/g.10667 Transcript_4894/m.10667 type:complete len:509 (-) Transcript_4894:112-1638(-)